MSHKKVKSAAAARIRRRNRVLLFLTVTILLIVMLFTPLFDITDITVKGTRVLKPDEVIKISGIKKGTNLFRFNADKAEEKIASLGYVESVEVNRKFLARVEIKITESTEVAYITFSGNYIGVDADGKVISITKSSKFKPKKAIVSGYAVKDVAKGKTISGKNVKKTKVLRELLAVLQDNEMISSVKKIDISDLSSIYFVMSTDTKIILGDSEQTDYKLKCLDAVFDELGEIRGGKVDISDPSNVVYEGGN